MARCLTCSFDTGLGQNNCTGCVDNTSYLQGIVCQPCSNMPYCLECSSGSVCLSCQNDSFLSASFLCQPCSSYSPQCLSCTPSACTACLNDSYYLALGGLTCLLCSFPLSGCLTCTSTGSSCLSCQDDTYFLDNDGRCHPCSDGASGCITCQKLLVTGVFNCSLCQNGTYFASALTTCQACSVPIPNCLLCDNSSVCLSCLNGSFAYIAADNACQPCSSLFPGCLLCTPTECTLCRSDLRLERSVCVCLVGWLADNGVCTTIVGCTFAVNYIDGSKGCSACENGEFFSRPVNEACQCRVGVLAGRVCINIPGCLSALTNTAGEPYCVWCNITAGFNGIPQSGVCECLVHTKLIGNECVEVCGDGFLISKVFECDDGNTANGDGCSSACRIETGYRCKNGSDSSASACVYVGIPLSVTLFFVEREDELNRGIIEFEVYPPLLNIGKMNLTSSVSLGCPAAFSLSSVSYSAGVLRLEVDYTEDL
jgi:cysteine-rich repeat protein